MKSELGVSISLNLFYHNDDSVTLHVLVCHFGDTNKIISDEWHYSSIIEPPEYIEKMFYTKIKEFSFSEKDISTTFFPATLEKSVTVREVKEISHFYEIK